MKTLLKFISISGWLSTISLVSIIVIIISSLISQQKISFAGESLINTYRDSSREKLVTQSFIIKTADALGSGFRPQKSNAFITNHHVVNFICNQGMCPSVAIQYADWSDFQIIPLEVKFCSVWMDLCVLVPLGESLDLTEIPTVNQNTQYEIAILAHEGRKFSNDLSILKGKTIQSSGGISVLQLNTKQGYSGSPVFNMEGNVVSIVSRTEPKSLYQLVSNVINYSFYKNNPATETIAIDILPFINLLNSKDRFQYEVSLFVEYFRQIKLAWSSFKFLEELYRAEVYVEGKNELCLKNPTMTVFERDFQLYCLSAMNLIPLGAENTKNLGSNELINFFISKDKEVKALYF